MKRLLMLLLLAPLALHAQQGDLPRMLWVSYDGAPLYADPDYLSSIVDTLVRGDSLVAVERLGRFLRVEIGGASGWILEANLSRTGPPAGRDVRQARRADSADAASPRGTADTADTTAQRVERTTERSAAPSTNPRCAAVTRKGTQCSRAAADQSPYCWQHGGRK